MPSKTDFSDYNPSGDFMERVRERQIKEKERYEAAKEAANNVLSQKYSSGGTITSTSYANSAITINGDAVNGSVTIDVPLLVNGRDVIKELDEMRDVLLLLKRDVDMEAKYPRLKEIKDEYEAALAKYTTFDAIKESK
jgi:hypothetical protein